MWTSYILASAGGALSGLLLYALTRRRAPSYAYDPEAPWGPHWGAVKPPGLPPDTRYASLVGEGEPLVRQEAGRHRLGGAFVQAVVDLGRNESRNTLARPANIFDARCSRPGSASDGQVCLGFEGPRDGSSDLITAWGLFQFNRGAWWGITGREEFPWEASLERELGEPIRKYAELWRRAKSGGADDISATRVIRLWHRSPSAAEDFLREGSSSGAWHAAWLGVDPRHQAALDEKIG